MRPRAAEIRAGIARLIASYGVRSLVHVGAHEGEEVADYLAVGIERVTLVEPIPELAARLRAAHPGMTVFELACSDADGHATLHVPERTNMASLTALGEQARGIRVTVRRLDGLVPDADAAVIDAQGHEMNVLAGAPWQSLRVIVVETCTVDDPTIAAPHDEVIAYADRRGFVEVRRFTRDYDHVQHWAFGRRTQTGGEIRDVVLVRKDLA